MSPKRDPGVAGPPVTISETCRCGASTSITAAAKAAAGHVSAWRDAHVCDPQTSSSDRGKSGAGGAFVGFAPNARRVMGHNDLDIQAVIQ